MAYGRVRFTKLLQIRLDVSMHPDVDAPLPTQPVDLLCRCVPTSRKRAITDILPPLLSLAPAVQINALSHRLCMYHR